MELRIVNPRPEYAPPKLVEPPTAGYLHIAASIAPPSGPPFVRPSAARTAALTRCRELAGELERLEVVHRVSVYRAVLIPPLGGDTPRPARYDVAVLVEATSPDGLGQVKAAGAYERLRATLDETARVVHVLAARCVRSLGGVDRTRNRGLFLFNHFVTTGAADVELATRLWEHLAGWYVTETGLDNSTLLAPTDRSGADYVLVNHARFDKPLLKLGVEQFAKPSFHTYVRANLAAHQVVAMPVLYRLAR